MDPTKMLYPAFAMFVLTAGSILSLGVARYRAIHRREVSIKFFRLYDEGAQPRRLALLARHVQNHFEVPPLFYVAVVLSFVTGNVTALSVGLAWAFVAFRAVHTCVHLAGNNVSRRFLVFGASLLALIGLWATLAVHVTVR